MAGDKTYITDGNGKLHRATRTHKVTPESIVWSSNPNDYAVQVRIDGKWHRAFLTMDAGTATYFDNINIDKALVTGTDGKTHTCLICSPEASVTMSSIKTDQHSLVAGTTTGETAVNVYSETWSNVQWQDNVNVYKVLVTGSDGKVHTALLTTSVTGGVEVIIKGTSPLVLPDAIANSLSYVKAFGGTAQNGTPTPTTPIDIVCNNGAIKVKDSELPVGYRRVLGYACNNNVLWQITDFHLRGSDTIRISFSVTVACNVFGCYQGTDATDNYDLYVSTSSGSKYLRYGDGTYLSYWSSANLGQRFDVVFTPTGTTGMPQDSTWEPLTFESENDFLIGSTTLTGSSSKLKGNLYGNVIVDGRLKLIPCERVSDGVLGYFDTYSQTFYEPQGAATSLGYDTSYMTKVYADGTVETINVHGKNLIDVTDFSIPNNSSTSALWTGSMTGPLCLSVDKSQVTSVGTPGTRFLILVVNGNTTYVGYNDADSVAINGTLTSIKCYNSLAYAKVVGKISLQLERGTTTTAYEPYYDGGTATAEMLLKVGDYQDVQSIIDGVVTRNVGVKVLDGTENFETATATNCYSLTNTLGTGNFSDRTIMCSHFANTPTMPDTSDRQGLAFIVNKGPEYTIAFGATTQFSTQALWQQFLADQYAAGAPVIVVYPLATPTTESVAGQTLQVQAGDNTLEITQASLTGLELEAQYNAAVSLTIQEVEDANLDNNVTVTIQ